MQRSMRAADGRFEAGDVAAWRCPPPVPQPARTQAQTAIVKHARTVARYNLASPSPATQDRCQCRKAAPAITLTVTDAGQVTQVPVERTTVITADGIGGVTIGSSKQDVERVLFGEASGAEADGFALTGGTLQDGLDIAWGRETTDAPLLVCRVATEDSRYKTARGVGVGSSVADVKEEPGVVCDEREGICAIGLKTARTTLGFILKDAHVVAIGVASNE